MPVSFHYVPLAPDALPGPAFISQTEKAFTELGSGIETANNAASQALAASGSALATAADALATANNASSEAMSAGDTAAGAFAAAKDAQQSADAAQGRANAAYDLAADAKSTADTKSEAAQATADAALGATEIAQTMADAAMAEATLARGVAQGAQNLAEEANGEFHRVDLDKEGAEALNADAYPDPAKVFFDGASSVLGLPDDYADKGGYLKVYATEQADGNSRTLQIFYAPDGSESFRREGERTAGEGNEVLLTWGAWLSSVPDAAEEAKLAQVYEAVQVLIREAMSEQPEKYEFCEFYFFRHPTLRPGFKPAQGGLLASAATLYPEAWAYLQTAEGQLLCKTESEWQAMTTATWATLADGTKVGWNGIGGAPFYAPNTATGALRLPDLRGMYAEAAGYDSFGVGGVHGDAIRNITGSFRSMYYDTTGAFYYGSGVGDWGNGAFQGRYTYMDPSRVVPTANKNQVRAWGSLACVYLGLPAS